MAAWSSGVFCFPVAAHKSSARRVPPLADFALRRPAYLLFLRASSGLGVVRVSSGKLGRLASCADVGDVPIPFCCVFGSLVSSPAMADGSLTILGGGVTDTRSVIQVRLDGGSTVPDLATVSMLWGSSSTSVSGWSSGIGHGGRRCFSFVSVTLVDWIVIFFSSRVLSVMWGALFMF
jgi:hypothetical protein